MPRRFCLAFAATAALAACNLAIAQDTDDPSNPHYKQAQQDLDNNNPAGATDEYEAALAANPNLAGAHYELGVLYAEKLAQPISAIYHLERFLKLAPTSDHAPAAREMINTEGEAFAASLPNSSPSNVQLMKLQKDNTALRQQVQDAGRTISQLQSQLAQAAAHPAAPSMAATEPATGAAPALIPTPTDSTAVPPGPPHALPLDTTNVVASPGAPTTDAAGNRSYTVKQGDILWIIAKKMYPHHNPNEGVKKIQDANPGVIKGTLVHPGQVLVIPD